MYGIEDRMFVDRCTRRRQQHVWCVQDVNSVLDSRQQQDAFYGAAYKRRAWQQQSAVIFHWELLISSWESAISHSYLSLSLAVYISCCSALSFISSSSYGRAYLNKQRSMLLASEQVSVYTKQKRTQWQHVLEVCWQELPRSSNTDRGWRFCQWKQPAQPPSKSSADSCVTGHWQNERKSDHWSHSNTTSVLRHYEWNEYQPINTWCYSEYFNPALYEVFLVPKRRERLPQMPATIDVSFDGDWVLSLTKEQRTKETIMY